MNSTDQIELHANMNETVEKDIYTDMEIIRAQTDGNDRKKQAGKFPGKYFSLKKMKHCVAMLLCVQFFTAAYTLFFKLN